MNFIIMKLLYLSIVKLEIITYLKVLRNLDVYNVYENILKDNIY